MQLETGDGVYNHWVSVIDSYIFDSNKEKSIILSKESLDSCCADNSKFYCFDTIYQYQTKNLKRGSEKIKDDDKKASNKKVKFRSTTKEFFYMKGFFTQIYDAVNEWEQRCIDKVGMSTMNTDSTVSQLDGHVVTLKDFLTIFNENTWLNDAIIQFYMRLLRLRDERLVYWKRKSKKRCYFYTSSFFNNSVSAEDDVLIDYEVVKNWSNKVPLGNIFTLDKLFVPINQCNQHWTLCMVDFCAKKICYFDSMSKDGMRYLKAMEKYLQKEHEKLVREKRTDSSSWNWELIQTPKDCPQQGNGWDCGVFVCMYADCLSLDYDLKFDQKTATMFRKRCAYSILSKRFL